MACKIHSGEITHWQCAASAKPKRLPQLCKKLLVGMGTLAAASAMAEVKTWSWVGTTKDCNYGGLITKAYNWADEGGQNGVPARGDTVRLVRPSGSQTFSSNNGEATYPWGDVYWTASGASQFFLSVETGHKLQIGGNWVGTTGLSLYGDGETEIESTSGADLKFQKPFNKKEGSPTLVKNGKWTLVCYYQAGNRDYTIPFTKIKQGKINITTAKAQNGLVFYFDGDDSTQCLEYTCKDGGTIHADGLVLKNSAIIETNGVANTGHSISADYEAQISFTGTPKVNPMVFSGQFAKKAGLTWSPASADYTFVCSNATSTTTGRMSVEKGTLKLVTGATFTALTELSVSAGAVFDVDAVSGAGFSAASLTLGDVTAKLKLAAGVQLTFNAATLAAAAMAPGVYSADGANGTRAAAWIEGPGTVNVLTGPANADTWVGGDAGGDATSLDGNWQMGVAPDFAAGDLLATFAAGGSSATLTGEAKFDGLVLKNAFGGSAFTFASGAGAAAEIGATGLTVLDAMAATTWTVNWPLSLAKAQAWSVGANNTVNLAGGISGESAVTVDNAGTIGLAAPSTHTGALTLNSGTYNVSSGNALGAASRTVSFDHSKAKFNFSGTTVQSAPMDSGAFVNTEPSAAFMTFADNSDTTFKGKIQWIGEAKMSLGKNATATFAGGIQAVLSAVYSHLYLTGSGTLVVTNQPFNAARQLYVKSGQSPTVDFRVTNNRISGDDWCEFYGGKLFTRVANAFQADQLLRLGSTTWDLCGTDQRVGVLATSEQGQGSAIKSDGPATLSIASNRDPTGQGGVNRVDCAVFSGKVSLVKNGVGTHAIGVESPTEGSIEVQKGVLRMTSSGKWPNCVRVTVSGGTLRIQNEQAFGEKAVWSVASTAVVDLDNVGTNACDYLYVDGGRSCGGVYGAVGSGAACEVSWITGTGFLKVPERGTAVFLR